MPLNPSRHIRIPPPPPSPQTTPALHPPPTAEHTNSSQPAARPGSTSIASPQSPPHRLQMPRVVPQLQDRALRKRRTTDRLAGSSRSERGSHRSPGTGQQRQQRPAMPNHQHPDRPTHAPPEPRHETAAPAPSPPPSSLPRAAHYSALRRIIRSANPAGSRSSASANVSPSHSP